MVLLGTGGVRFLCTGTEDLASSGSRAALGTFGCSGWCSGGLPELTLGSPKVIWSCREFILESLKVIFELPRVIFVT